ncbi:MAG: transcriptional repressor LexA [Clostridiales bacterium]|nr:MAG: transcriptional repressor LexA [Clostridiales bacterium]
MRSKNEQTLNNILKLINDCYFESGTYPTFQQIAAEVGLSVPQTYRYVDELIKRGDLEKNGRYGDLQTKEIVNSLCSHNRLPIVGEVACGTPILAEENIECFVTFSRELLGSGKFFILRAKGESMINAGIEDGDLVIVRQQDTAEEGQIVVALIENEATLKRYYIDRRRHKVRLHRKRRNERYVF